MGWTFRLRPPVRTPASLLGQVGSGVLLLARRGRSGFCRCGRRQSEDRVQFFQRVHSAHDHAVFQEYLGQLVDGQGAIQFDGFVDAVVNMMVQQREADRG